MAIQRRLLCFLVACVVGGSVLTARADERLVGVAKVDVTPSYPIRLNGFGNRRDESEGITQPIYAKALAIGADEEKPLVLITVDSLGIRMSMADEVAARLAKKAGIERSRVAIAFSHSHTTPKVIGACDTIFSSPIPPEHQAHIDRYTTELTDALEAVALAALADRKPSRLEWAVGKVGFAKNRRTEGGPVDHDLPMMVVRSADDNAIRAIYVTYACHCVTLSDNKISGDWAGFAQQAIEANHPGVVALVSIGCGSDSNPDSGVTGGNTAAAADQGAQIADEVERLLAGTFKPITGKASATLNTVKLPLNPPPSREQFEQVAAQQGQHSYNAQYQLAKLDRGEPLLTEIDYPIQTWAFGDSLNMVFLGGEICVDYALRLKKELDPTRVWLHGYSNDFCCYIPSERLLKEGGYGGGGEIMYFAMPNTLAAGLEQKIIDEVHRQVPKPFKRPDLTRQSSSHALPVENSLATIKPKEGWVVELVVSEPLVADPVAIDFGADGRLWVAEMTDYSRFAEEKFEQSGSVRVLTDRNGDGKYDEATTFQTGLRFPTDVKAWRNGVIVCDAPDVIYLEDSDGDGRADVRKVLLTGFETQNAQARVNSLRWGLDNWVYGSCGLLGGTIKSFNGAELKLGSRDFRFRPDTGEIEAVTGRTQQGRSRDDWGNWFGCENGALAKHYPLADHYLARNPHVAPPPAEVFVPAGDNPHELHPIGEPTVYKLSGPPGRTTSACGLGFYRDELLGGEFANNVFTAEPVNNLVHRLVLSKHGATFRGDRATDERDREFVASTDAWFRPVQICTGLDGCLWIVDMHRAVIEHPKFIPEETLRELDLMAGRKEGRIYRVRPKNVAPRPVGRLDQLDAVGLASAIDSPNGPRRDLAHQLLVQRGPAAKAAAPQLMELTFNATRPAVRLQALCALDGLNSLNASTLTRALADEHPAVRRHALRLSEPYFADSPDLTSVALSLVDDSDPQVQLQLAYSLGEMDDPRAAEVLAKLAWGRHADPYVMAGVWSSVRNGNVASVVRHLLAPAANGEIPAGLLDPAIKLAIALGDAECIGTIAAALNVMDEESHVAPWRLNAAVQLLEQERQEHGAADSEEDREAARRLAPIIAAARTMLESAEGAEADRLAALRIVAASETDHENLLPLLTQHLGPQSSPAIQQTALDLLASINTSEAGDALLENWASFTPTTRAMVFDLMLGRKPLLAQLLDKLAEGEVRAADLDALQRQRLLTHSDLTVRDAALRALAGAIDANRDAVVTSYLAAPSADGSREGGRSVFRKHCSSCHVLEGEGHAVGPDLAALSNRDRKAMVESIFDPNRAVDERYQSYAALTVDGLAHAGILKSETSTSITLVEQQGQEHTLLRTDIESLQNSGKSLMPEGLERDLSEQDLVNLLAYLTAQRPPRKAFVGNEPRTVVADGDGKLLLLAANCEIYGDQIMFEQPYKNIGYWHAENDHVAWNVETPLDGEYEVYLDWACADDSARNAAVIEGCEPPVRFVVEGTGSYDQYRRKSLGRVMLVAGVTRIVMRPDGPLSTFNLIDLRGLHFVPLAASAAPAVPNIPSEERQR